MFGRVVVLQCEIFDMGIPLQEGKDGMSIAETFVGWTERRELPACDVHFQLSFVNTDSKDLESRKGGHRR